jgi:hypothetical protein
MEMTNDSERKSQSWLERVQEQSWEPEILISGIILFGLFQIPPYIEQAMFYLENYSHLIFSGGTVDEGLGALLLTANIWLIIGFTTHLIGRSIWVAFVGMSYVYKDGIILSNLKYQENFKKAIAKNSDYKLLILRLERFCSRIFAISFLLFMCVVGISFFLVVVGFLIVLGLEFIPDFERFSPFIDPVITIVSLIYFIDFVGLGVLKRIPVFSKIYYPFYKVMSYLTLSPLYRSIYYGIVTNHKPWKVGLSMLAFAVITFLMGNNLRNEENFLDIMIFKTKSDDEEIYFGHYENLYGDHPSQRIQITSDVIESEVLRVFVVHRTQYEQEQILPLCNYDSLIEQEEIDKDSLVLECLTQFYDLKIDDAEVSENFLFHKNHRSGQVGLFAYLDISELEKGLHRLSLYYNFVVEGEEKPTEMAIVEFYKTQPSKKVIYENQTRED